MEWRNNFKGKHGEGVPSEVVDYLDKNREHRKVWKGVPISRDGKVRLRDGRTGEYFDSPVTIGHMHYLKLHHLVDDKIHGARSYRTVLPGNAAAAGWKSSVWWTAFRRDGGLGSGGIWCVLHTLQGILTVKSDDVIGRVKTYEAIIKGENIPEAGIPESFKVLLKELQALGLDVRVLRDDNTEVELTETSDYGDVDIRSILKTTTVVSDREDALALMDLENRS